MEPSWNTSLWPSHKTLFSLVWQSPRDLGMMFWNFTTSETSMLEQLAKIIVRKVSHGLLKDLILRILGNLEILRKGQNWLKTEPSAQSSFHKSNFCNGSQNHTETVIKVFCSCIILLDFFTLFQIFFPEVVVGWTDFCL